MAINTQSLLFNGVNQYAKLNVTGSMKPTLRNLSNFTWMAYIKVGDQSVSSQQRAYTELQGTANSNTRNGIRFACVPYKGKLRFEFSAKDGRLDTNYDYNLTWDERWHHVAFVARVSSSPATYEMYLDGATVASGTLVVPSGTTAVSDTDPIASTNPAGSFIYLGAYSNHASGGNENMVNYWHGAIDDVILFNTAKNSSEILSYISRRNSWDNADADIFSHWEFNNAVGASRPYTGTALVDKDNATWTGSISSTDMWSGNRLRSNDRPYLGVSSNTASASADSTAPAAPVMNAFTLPIPTGGTVSGSFQRSSDNVFVQQYVVEVATVSNFSTKVTQTLNVEAIDGDYSDKSFTLTGLLPNTTYYVRALAIDAALNPSAVSNVVSFTTPNTEDLFPPDPPRNLSATSIGPTSFVVSFDAANTFTPPATGLDTVAYSVDVALDSSFSNYVSGFQNKDLGSLRTFTFDRGEPLTKYFVRARGRDAEGNDSVSSPTLIVMTTSLPDLVPPNPVETLPATSVTARGFTANWELGVDNVGVSHYHVDVAKNSTFTQYASTPLVAALQNVNVGNVLAYRFEDLQPDTIYYYRVRAQDDAGNTSPDTTSYMEVRTLPISLDDGGSFETTFFPTADSYTNSVAAASNHGTQTSLYVAGNGSANFLNTYIQVDLRESVGTIQSVMLKLYTIGLGTGAITVAVDNVTFSETGLTWNNQPAIAGSTIAFTPLANNAWVEVDIGSLFIDGPAIYTIRLTTTTNTTYQFSSREGTNPPQITLMTDASTSTRLDGNMVSTNISGTITNLLTNPSFASGTTTGWVGVGSTPATLANISYTNAYSGTRALQITANGASANQGAASVTNTVNIAGKNYVTAGVSLRSSSGTTAWRVVLKIYNSSSVLLTSSTTTITLRTDVWQRANVLISNIQSSWPTATYAAISIETNGTASGVALASAAIIADNGPRFVGYFDGNTSGAYWTGTANASASRMGGASMSVASSYIGDSDNDAWAYLALKKTSTNDWILSPTTATMTRATKTATTVVSPTIAAYNMIHNPTFVVTNPVYGPDGWFVYDDTAISRETEITDGKEYAIRAYIETAGLYSGFESALSYGVVAGNVVQAHCRLRVTIGTTVELGINFYNSAGALITSTVTAPTSIVGGTGDWVTAYIPSATAPAGTVAASIVLKYSNQPIGEFYMTYPMLTVVENAAFITGITYLQPYRDGTFPDAFWEGKDSYGYTGLRIQENTNYDIQHIYTDPDGVVNGITATLGTIAKTFLTPNIPDNVATFDTLTGTSVGGEAITVQGTYLGDDNNNMTVVIEHKRYDLTDWTIANTMYNRELKQFSAWIPGLREGTKYAIRATMADADGVYGTNPRTIDVTTESVYAMADPVPYIAFDGFVLQGRNDSFVGVESHDAFGFPQRRLQTQDYAREHGGVELSDFWGKREINMSGFVSGESRAELEANLAALKRALAPSNKHLVIDTLTQYGRHYMATCTNLSIPEVGAEHYRHLKWNATFTCVDPFAYDSNKDTVSMPSVIDGGEVTVINTGDLPVSPTLTLTTKHTRAITLSVENLTTGERIVPFATLRSGQTIVIDNERKALYKNGVEAEYAGGFFTLAAGTNTLVFNMSAESVSGETPYITLEMEWRAKYL